MLYMGDEDGFAVFGGHEGGVRTKQVFILAVVKFRQNLGFMFVKSPGLFIVFQ